LFKEAEIAAGIEDGVPPIIEPRAPEFNGSENLHALALSGHSNFRRTTDATPGGVQRRVLPETGLIGEDQRPAPRLGFFLMFG
jgi:hypothetical protein